MFLVITSVSEGSDGTSNFQLFDISVDGEYFCSLRYSQLRSFHMQLSKAFSSLGLPEFPPKKFGSLSRHQLEQRRLGIETYLRIIVHVPRITTSLLFKNFFLAAQFASWSGTADPISLAVHLLGGESVVLPSVGTLDREELVKERFTKKIGLRKNIIQFFTFHVAQQEEDGSLTMIRQLYPMESPVVTLYRGGPGRRLVFARKTGSQQRPPGRNILLFLDLAAKQSDFLSTVIGGLTLELASGKCNGAVILMRDSLQVSCRVRGGDTDGGYHKVLGKMNWSDIVSWSLVHQCQPSLRIKYKGPGPLNGQVSISGQSVPYLAQCIDAIIAMTTALKEAAVQKPEEEIPTFPKVTRAEIIWPPTSTPPLRARPQPPPPQEEQVTAGGGRLQQEQQGQCRPQQPLPPQQWQQQTRWSQQQLQQQLAQQQLLRQQQQQQQQLPSQQPLQLLPQQQMLPQQQLIPQQQQQLLPQQQQLLPQQQQQLLPQQPLQQLLPQQQQRQQQQLLPQQQRRQQQLSQQQLLPQQQQQLTQQPLQQLLPQQQQQQQQLPQQQQLLPRQQQLLPQQPLQQLLPQQQQQQQLPQQQLSQQPLQQLLPQQQQQQQLSQQPLQQLLPQQQQQQQLSQQPLQQLLPQQQQQLSQQPLQQLLPQQQQQQQLSQQPLQQLLPQQQQQQQLSQQPLQQLLPQQQQQQLSQQPLQQLLPQQQQQQLSQQPLQPLLPQQQQQQQLSQQPLQQLLPQQQQEQEQSLEAVVTSSRRQRTQTF